MNGLINNDGSLLARYNNGLHAQFHQRMYQLVTAEDTAALNLSADLLTEWRRLIDLEISINREAQAFVETKLMEAKDSERDALITYIFGLIRSQTAAPIASLSEAARRLEIAIRPYAGLQKEAYDAESLHIIGLLEDFAKPQLAADLGTLGLTAVTQQLKQLNEEYMALRVSRTEQRADQQLPPSKVVRPQTDEAYYTVCRYIEATYLLGSAQAKATIDTLARRMNQLITELRTTYRQGQAQRKGQAQGGSSQGSGSSAGNGGSTGSSTSTDTGGTDTGGTDTGGGSDTGGSSDTGSTDTGGDGTGTGGTGGGSDTGDPDTGSGGDDPDVGGIG